MMNIIASKQTNKIQYHLNILFESLGFIGVGGAGGLGGVGIILGSNYIFM